MRDNSDIATKAEFPRFIEIQTTSACNGACVICPHPEVWREGFRGRMDDQLFKSIIDQCVPFQKGLKVIPYLNGEPFIDPQFIDRARYINQVCPDSEIEVSSNTSLLNANMRLKLLQVRITELRLSVFGFSRDTHKLMMPGLNWSVCYNNLCEIVQDTRLRDSIDLISLTMIEHPSVPSHEYDLAKEFCDSHNVKFNRWGYLDRSRNVGRFSNEVNHKTIRGCEQHRPLERIHIQYNGDVILCCQDWRGTIKLGNLNDMTISDVWNSEQYDLLRKVIYGVDNSIKQPALCLNCKLAIPK